MSTAQQDILEAVRKIQALERERCARLCEEIAVRMAYPTTAYALATRARQCAAAIRALPDEESILTFENGRGARPDKPAPPQSDLPPNA